MLRYDCLLFPCAWVHGAKCNCAARISPWRFRELSSRRVDDDEIERQVSQLRKELLEKSEEMKPTRQEYVGTSLPHASVLVFDVRAGVLSDEGKRSIVLTRFPFLFAASALVFCTRVGHSFAQRRVVP